MNYTFIDALTNISLAIMVCLCALLAGCSSSAQLQQNEEPSSRLDSTAVETQEEPPDNSKNEDERTKALKEKYRDQLREDYRAEANEVTTLYIHAQRRFYNGNYKSALYYVNKAMEIRENADLYALRGNIYLGLQNTDKFKENWRKALTMDENVPLPLTDYIVKKLQEHGLLNKNLEPNF